MKSIFAMSLVFIGLGLAGCGGNSSNGAPAGAPANYSYPDFAGENGCHTWAQGFDTHEHFCMGLRNNQLNNNCALEARARHFRKYCSGDFVPYYDNNPEHLAPGRHPRRRR